MPKVSQLFIWPPTGWYDKPWVEPDDNDAFVKSSRRVCELYSEGLAQADIDGRCREIRFSSHEASPDPDPVHVLVHTDFISGWEMINIAVPKGAADLTPEARGLLVLDTIHGGVLRLAQARGWDPDKVEHVRQHCLARRLDYTWDGRWKASPSRRYDARGEFRLLDYGFGVTRIAIRDRRTGEVVGASREATAYCTHEGFKRSADSLRWKGSDRVRMVPFSSIVGDKGKLVAKLDDLSPWEPWPEVPEVDLDVPRPSVTVVGRGPDAPEQGPEIIVIGGGPMNGVPGRYHKTLDRLLRALRQRGVEWWSGSDRAILEIEYYFEAARPGVILRRRPNLLKATLNRPVSTMRVDAPDELAVADVQALVDAVTRKEGLGPPPDLS